MVLTSHGGFKMLPMNALYKEPLGGLRSPSEAGKQFQQWASLFSGKLLVKVVAYIDESGTHDRTGASKGSSVIVIAGLVAMRVEWIDFCSKWQRALNKYSAGYFHFREWTAASLVARGKTLPSKDFKNNPYQGWGKEKLNSFLFELAEIAGSGNKVIVGVYVTLEDFHKAKPGGEDPYKCCLNCFFEDLPGDIRSAWPFCREPVSIFYDWTENRKWRNEIVNAHDFYRKKYGQIKELTFADKKEHLPLQAADMVAYRFRQTAEKFNRFEPLIETPKLDRLLLASLARQSPPKGVFRF
jgi:hypothetical protein